MHCNGSIYSDDSLVEEYKIQVLSGYQEGPTQAKECEDIGTYGQLIADEKLERTGVGFLRKCVFVIYVLYCHSVEYLILVCIEWYTEATSEE